MIYLQKLLFTLLTIIFFFASLFVYTKLVGPIPFNIDSVVTTKADTFTVTGEGKSTIKPDSAQVNVGVVVTAPTAAAAQKELNEKINQVIAAVKDLSIPEQDVKTENYNVNPNYDYSGGSDQRITNYSASTTLTITVKDIKKVNSVIDTASQNGANQIGGVTFESKNSKKAEEEARKEAVKNAKAQAQQAANAAGFKLGRLINYSEGNQGPIRPFEMVKQDTVGIGGGGADIQPGLNEVTIIVTLSYKID